MTCLRRLSLAALCLLGACASDATSDAGSREAVVVFAASSLTDAFREIAVAFEDAHPDASIELNFAGSSSLREQILSGAPAAVYASANAANMAALSAAGAVDAADPFATNELEIVVPAGNPGAIGGLADFGSADLLIGLCAPQVPCGEFARAALERAGVDPAPDTEEPDVRALLTKVAAGELDAGIVYATDVVAAGADVVGVEIAPEFNVTVTYLIATVAASGGASSVDFVAFVTSSRGAEILQRHGFGVP